MVQPTASTLFALDPGRTAGAPRRLSIIGGALLITSSTFPWFTAGAISTDPFTGRALAALIIGVIAVALGTAAARATAAWSIGCSLVAVIGLILVLLSSLAPPRALSPSTGVALALVGSVLVGLGVVTGHWRSGWVPTTETADETDDPGSAAITDTETASVETADDQSDGGELAAHAEDSPAVAPARRSPIRRTVRVVALVVAAALGVLFFWPASTPDIAAEPDPTETHAEALARFEELTADEPDVVFEPCESQLFSHGERTEVAVVLFHGLTNCPKQFVEFGQVLFDAGANVLILRAPDHGRANADGTGIGSVANVKNLSAESLREYADNSVDIATGLGDEVRVLGLSMGGVLATWTAQERDDVDRVVAVAPAINIPFVPSMLTHVFRNVFGKLPNVSLPSAGSKLDHAYSGETTKGLDATFSMAAYVADSAYEDPPAAGEVIVVLNPDDEQVDPTHLAEFTNAWASTGGPVSLYRFPISGLRHDLIDLDQPGAQPDAVYPILQALLDGERP